MKDSTTLLDISDSLERVTSFLALLDMIFHSPSMSDGFSEKEVQGLCWFLYDVQAYLERINEDVMSVVKGGGAV